MRVTYMISLNHDVPAQSITKLHAYKFAANPRNPAQTRTFPRNATRKFGLKDRHRPIRAPKSQTELKEVDAFPAHRDLDHAMQLAKRNGRRHVHPAPYHRAEPQQPNLELHNCP